MEIKKRASEIVKLISDRVIKERKVWGLYTLDLTLKAMLEWSRTSGEGYCSDYVFEIVKERGWTDETRIPYEAQPFCHINYTLYRMIGDGTFGKKFVEESKRFFNEVPRSEDGLVLLRDKSFPRHNVLIDFMQDYTSRMAATGNITGDETFYKECVEQFRRYRDVLRDSETGLWSTGRGWLDDDHNATSPGKWSRGHGWLIRGMVESLSALPNGSEYAEELRGYLVETADALLKVQDGEGMWHQLLNRDFNESYPDSSGTGLICYYLCKALDEGFLSGEKYLNSALSAFQGLSSRVTEDGSILNVCPGPGPLFSEEDYLNNPGETEKHCGHGSMAVIFACAGVWKVAE